jgi:two-component system, NarL family, sensor histidine kinase UhpB
MIHTQSPLNILVVEDNPADFFLLNECIRKTGLATQKILHAHRLKDALSIIEQNNPDLIFLDLALPDGQGIESFHTINKVASHLSIIVLSGLADKQIALHTISLGAQDYLVKGSFDETLLTKSIEYTMERKKYIRNATENFERYHSLIKATNDTVWDHDLRTNEISWNEGIDKIFGYTDEGLLTSEEWHFNNIHPYDRDRVVKKIQHCINSGTEQWNDEYRYVCSDGEIKFVYDRGFVLLDEYNRPYRMLGVMIDISERKKKEQELIRVKLERHKLITETTIQTQEKERRQIGRELHDNINQILVTAKLYVDVALREEEPEKELLYKSNEYIMKAIKEIRSVSKSLIFGSMKDIRLEEALVEIVGNMKLNKGLHVSLALPGAGLERLSADKKLAVYRIVQEQVNNLLRHSKATEAEINLKIQGDLLYVIIKDNGAGADSCNKKYKGIGLHNIASRVEMYNGKMQIITSPGMGYILTVELPLD